MTEAEFVDYLASKINEWIKEHFAGWIPAPHMDDFNRWAEAFRAGHLSKEEFYGLVLGKLDNEEVKE